MGWMVAEKLTKHLNRTQEQRDRALRALREACQHIDDEGVIPAYYGPGSFWDEGDAIAHEIEMERWLDQ